MINRKFWIIVILLCLCLHLMPCQAMAASTSDAVEPILPEKECSLTISYCYGETAFSGVEVKLYQIADVSADFHYTLTKMFETSGLILEGIRTNGEWNVVRSTLEAHILADNIAPAFTAVTSEAGQVRFDGLKTGMYLAIVDQIQQGEWYYQFDSALVAVPGLGTDGRWQYSVSVNAKGEALPPADSDKTIELKVLKLWRGDEGRSDRPQSIVVEIFRNGESFETVTLSAENNWAYTWSAKDDGSTWMVVERNVPKGYVMTLEQREATFVVTNTHPGDSEKPPQTGYTTNLLLYVLLMIGSGTLLVVLGVTGKKTCV
jgi:hypothetical protein